MFSRFVDFNGRSVGILDFLIIGFCLASLDQVVGVTYPPAEGFDIVCTIYYYYDADVDKFYFAVCDGCKDTPETRKNAIFEYCDSLTSLYRDIPVLYRDMLNGLEHCASIRSRGEFNIDIDSL